MNRILITILTILSVVAANAQVPQGIPYQAVARNGQGQPLSSHAINVRFKIGRAHV